MLPLIVPTALVGQGQNFVLLEESRLPADTSDPGISATDLVDVDGDGDLDYRQGEGRRVSGELIPIAGPPPEDTSPGA